MDAQVQQLTQALNTMATRMEEQTQRLHLAEQQVGAADAAAARSETSDLHTRMQSNVEQMPDLITALTEAVKTQKNKEHGGQSMIDKATGKPTAFDEKEENFPGWRRRFDNFIV